MPRRGNGARRWNDNYNEHDDRAKNPRRVSFKSNPNKNKNRIFGSALKKLEEDDIDMNDRAIVIKNDPNKFRRNFQGGGRGRKNARVNSPAPRQGFTPRQLMRGASPWYQVTIPYGSKHDKNFVLKTLMNALAPDLFVPFAYSNVGNAAIFYVDDFEIAEKLFNTDRTIVMPDGFKLVIKVKNGMPHVNLDANVMQKIKTAMAGRYNAENKALDLTKFHVDPALIDEFCVLFRSTTMLAALDLIAENIPDLEALNLNDNKIHNLDSFRGANKKLPNLKILYFANNRISHINALEPLKSFPMVELFFEGNPFVDRFKEKDVYVREMRKRFPKLTKLDGVNLPPVIGFDVSDDVNLPPAKPSFLCNLEGQAIVRQFLEQYFALYDSDSRQPLLDAYHENAMFSLSSSYGPSSQNNPNKLNAYTSISRNLMRSQDRDVRRRHLKVGRLQVVSFLNDLPKTQHDPDSFRVDLTLYLSTMMMLTVNGIFKETSTSNASTSNRASSQPVRSFHKTIIIVPHGGGICILNDMLFVTNATSEQESKSFNSTPTTFTINTSVPPPQTPSLPALPMNAPANFAMTPDGQRMLQTLGSYSNMNLEWCTNCLEQTQWNMEKAVIIFDQLNSQGKIPPEAFIK